MGGWVQRAQGRGVGALRGLVRSGEARDSGEDGEKNRNYSGVRVGITFCSP